MTTVPAARRVPVVLVLLLTGCSSGSGTTTLGSPGPALPSSAAPSSHPPQPSPTPSPTAAPAARRTAEAVPSPTRTGATVGLAEVTGNRFSPSTLTVRSGDRVLVTNRDLGAHTFTISALGVDSGSMGQGDTFRYAFRAPGRYTFVCTYHESLGMTGTLTVTR